MTSLALAGGWLLHLGFWAWALARTGRLAARGQEWPREALLRLAMLALVVGALLWTPGPVVPLGATPRVLLLCAFLGGHLLAVTARIALAGAWGLGVQPRAPAVRVRSGPYRVLGHPIYTGTGTAILAQCALLQNPPAIAMALGTLIVIPLKVRAERAAMRRGA